MTARRALLPLALALAIVAALLYALLVMGAPSQDLRQIALILFTSGAGSLLLSVAVVRWGGARLSSLRLRFALAYGAGLLVALFNVLTASVLMFLSSHDLAFLLLVIGFSAVVSLAFGFSAGSTLVSQLGLVTRSAARLAAGDLGTRIGVDGKDEVARLAHSFDAMAERLQSAFERQRELEASRRDLVAAVSHDLRTPLATMRAMVEAVTDGVVTDPQEVGRYHRLMLGEIQHLSQLIDDLFELSQIESGALRLQLASTPISELVLRTLEVYRARAADSGVTLESTAAPSLPDVLVDPVRMQRVLRNLVDNGLHFTPPGGAVRVGVIRTGGALEITVSDTGPGIPVEDLERVFERFYRGERARSRGNGSARSTGAGLGLAIARGLVQAHGGRIWADRSAGGATFHFTIPLTAPVAASEAGAYRAAGHPT